MPAYPNELPSRGVCLVEGCDRFVNAYRYCGMHYKRFRAHGDPTVVLISATRNMTFEERWEAQVTRGPGCWEWSGYRDAKGYGHVTYDGRPRLASRVAWTTQVGPIPDGLLVLHHCDNPPCVRIEHLHLGTHLQNSREKWERGRAGGYGTMPTLNQGEGNVHAKLVEADVLAIRSAVSVSGHDLAARFNVTERTIRDVRNRRTWKHL